MSYYYLPISLDFIMTLLANAVCTNAFGNVEIIYNKVLYCAVELNCFLSAFLKAFLVLAQIMVTHLWLLVISCHILCLIRVDCYPELPSLWHITPLNMHIFPQRLRETHSALSISLNPTHLWQRVPWASKCKSCIFPPISMLKYQKYRWSLLLHLATLCS